MLQRGAGTWWHIFDFYFGIQVCADRDELPAGRGHHGGARHCLRSYSACDIDRPVLVNIEYP